MGQDSQRLEAVFEKVYRSRDPLRGVGQFRAERGKGVLARIVALIIGIPIHPDFESATLLIERRKDHDVWKRNFGGKKFSTMFYTSGEFNVEQFGLQKLYFKMDFGKSVYYESAIISVGWLRLERFVKIISNNQPVNENEWDFEVIIQSWKSELLFRYWGRMRCVADT